jgi:hypothetical protein
VKSAAREAETVCRYYLMKENIYFIILYYRTIQIIEFFLIDELITVSVPVLRAVAYLPYKN